MQVICAHGGRAVLADRPEPRLDENSVLVQTRYSAVSPGTETELLRSASIETPHPLGYSAVGEVLAVGGSVTHVATGDRVACYGGPYVCHAPVLAVPKTLCVPLPANVELDEAALVGLGAIAIHGVRRAGLQFGESVLVMGLGILGQIVSQVCLQAGFRVVASDRSDKRVTMAVQHGIRDAVCVFSGNTQLDHRVREVSDGHGVDAVIICAHSLASDIIDEALSYLAARGKIVVVGNISMSFSRETFFQKEADLVIARAAGPGRYDSRYEAGGEDYPQAYVRWTEGRNMVEYLRLLNEGRLGVRNMIARTYRSGDAIVAYDELQQNPGWMSVLFSYDGQ